MRNQRLIEILGGLGLLLFSALVMYQAYDAPLIQDRDITPVVVSISIGIAALLGKF